MATAFYTVMAMALLTSAILIPCAATLLARTARGGIGNGASMRRASAMRAALIFGPDLFRDDAQVAATAAAPVTPPSPARPARPSPLAAASF